MESVIKIHEKYRVTRSLGPYFDSSGELRLKRIEWESTWEPYVCIEDCEYRLKKFRQGVYDEFIIDDDPTNCLARIAWHSEKDVSIEELVRDHVAAVSPEDVERWHSLATFRREVKERRTIGRKRRFMCEIRDEDDERIDRIKALDGIDFEIRNP